jgi:hypothetical protein
MKSSKPLTGAEEREILHLLRTGHTARQTADTVGRSTWAVRRVQDDHCIEPGKPGSTGAPSTRFVADPLEPEEDGIGLADPWIPADGWDMHAERPSQRQWLAMVAAAGPAELAELRHAVCRVLRLPDTATGQQLELTVMRDRRSADELAGLYMLARGRRAAP